MIKLAVTILSLLFSALNPFAAFANTNSFVSVVNPIRGSDFWKDEAENPKTALFGQMEILDKFNIPATWLIRYDALFETQIINKLKDLVDDEKGIFLEITPTFTKDADVRYHKSENWHDAGSAFLSGYEREERIKLIDKAFAKFRDTFGIYPKSVGAWWIDAFSLSYMQEKYGVVSALIVADQYTTDNYQIWGQYFGTPYYPSKNNVLNPAQSLENKLPIVIVQWATRDPVNSYGKGVEDSTYSLQANDYIDFHNLDTKYFSKLIDIYTKQSLNNYSHLVVGLENSYSWQIYANEYENQIKVLSDKKKSGQISIAKMEEFASWYKSKFPNLSPEQIIVADDPLGTYKKVVWFMNPYFRAGWFLNQDGSLFRDIRQYIDGSEELCFKDRCDSVNFATSATRVLDEVSFGHKWIIDAGKIKDLRINKQDEKYAISYKNEAGNERKIEFLPRDIGIDGKIYSIDAAILNATKKENTAHQNVVIKEGSLRWSFGSVLLKLSRFLLFLALACIVPGLILADKLIKKDTPIFLRLMISSVVGFVVLTLLFYIISLLKIRPLLYLYVLSSVIIFIRFKTYRSLVNLPKVKGLLNLIIILVILVGVIFQVIPTFKSGLTFAYGMGFWGPNTHDGVWHLALVNQLIKSVPPESPIYSGAALKNYHFFYDLLVTATNYLSGIPVVDLLFRFYPVIFSLMFGIGSYYLIMKLFAKGMGVTGAKAAAIFSLYFIYFAGSFGWIVEYLREKHFGGESAFWANQAVSFNLNPPFAVSLVILIALLHILFSNTKGIGSKMVTIIVVGTLASFKSYTGILVLGALFFVATVRILRNKDFTYFLTSLFSLLITVLLFLSNFQVSSAMIVFAPFWFIHSMVDSPDRVGWVRLSLARTSSEVQGQWPKFILAEVTSLIIFIIGNLGLRFLSLGSLVKIKEIFKNDTLLFIFVMTILSIAIPILFIQSGNPWNTIQFFYPALYISALFSGFVISYLIFKLNKVFAFILVGVVLIFAPINSVVTANGYLGSTPHALISLKELEGLRFLSNQPNGVVLTYPYDEKLKTRLREPWPLFVYDSTAYVSAFSKKNVYLEDESQNAILLTDYKKRLVASKDFFLKSIPEGSKFLQDNNIRYIYLPKIYNVRLDESLNIVKNIFENEEVVIYQV